MSEFTPALGSSGGGGTGVAEYSTRRVLAGETEGARRRLVYALEALGYSVTSENPLQARRRRLKDVVRADFTEHARKVSVSLRPSSDTAVAATFDFEVKHGGCMMRGDTETLEREADAIVALAAAPPASTLCRACGTENGGDAHFCRLCGAPSVANVPAELEVLRLTAGSRASLQEITTGIIVALLTLAVTVPMILFASSKGVKVGWLFLAAGEVLGWLLTLYGIMRLHLTLNSKKRRARLAGVEPTQTLPQSLPSAQTTALPPASVTEGATELLGDAHAYAREKVHATRQRSDTSPIS